jgi:hypothetical protein
LYDDFGDQCLDSALWALNVAAAGTETPTPAAALSQATCVDTQRDFITEDEQGHLAVFLTLEGDVTDNVAQKSGACFREVEFTFSLHDVIVFEDVTRSAFLSVGAALQRVSGDSFLEVRLEGNNPSGRASPPMEFQMVVRLTTPAQGGYINLFQTPYVADQLATVAFRIKDNRLTVFLNHEAVSPTLSILPGSLACGLTLGYHADPGTLLDGYFDEVRVTPLP